VSGHLYGLIFAAALISGAVLALPLTCLFFELQSLFRRGRQ
jgi:hypothetical protein